MSLALPSCPPPWWEGCCRPGPAAPRLPGRRGGSLSQSSYRSAEIGMFSPSAKRFPPDRGFQRGSGKVADVRATRRRPSTAAGLRLPRQAQRRSERGRVCLCARNDKRRWRSRPAGVSLLPPRSKDREGSSEQMLRRHKGTGQKKPPPGEARHKPGGRREEEFSSLLLFFGCARGRGRIFLPGGLARAAPGLTTPPPQPHSTTLHANGWPLAGGKGEGDGWVAFAAGGH